MKETRTNRTNQHLRQPGRRGNTIVLVAGILVLLVIIATSYLTRTQSQRVVSVATNESHSIDASADIIAHSVAAELAMHLFVRPVDPEIYAELDANPAINAEFVIRDANWPRLHPTMYEAIYNQPARRYNVDWNFSFNFAPYHTIATTNWPDPDSLSGPWNDYTIWPAGPGNAGETAGNLVSLGLPGSVLGFAQGLVAAEYNALGNPSFGDNRLLADFEPMRIRLTGSGNLSGREVFSHWRKVSYLPHANNAYRVIADISDVDNNVVYDLNIPVDQWLAARPRNMVINVGGASDLHGAGNSSLTYSPTPPPENSDLFMERWKDWLGVDTTSFGGYPFLYANAITAPAPLPVSAPANFYNLRNLNAAPSAQIIHEIGERPQDEFVPGSWRHTVSRVLTDTDGDGFTDAYWTTTPISERNGVKTIAAFRIIDNSAMINVDTATRFHRNDTDEMCAPLAWPNLVDNLRKTRGQTPADVALLGQGHQGSPLAFGHIANFNTGFFDNPQNAYIAPNGSEDYGYRPSFWSRRFLRTIGLPHCGTDVAQFDNQILEDMLTQQDRRDYWRLAGRLGLSEPFILSSNSFLGFDGDPAFRPFTLSDEVELRMFHGNNYPWIYSRLEWSVQGVNESSDSAFLRANYGSLYQESSEYLDQLTNYKLLQDNRRKITTYNGARNDLLPPWLSWESRRYPSTIPHVLTNYVAPTELSWDDDIIPRFHEQARRKLDLRELDRLYHNYQSTTNGATAYFGIGQPLYHTGLFPHLPENEFRNAGRVNLRDRLADTLLLALTDSGDEVIPPSATYEPQATKAGRLEVGRLYGSYFGWYATNENPNPLTSDPMLDPAELWNPIADPPQAELIDPIPLFDNVNGPLNKTRRMAAAWASNILAYRSNQTATLSENRIELPKFGVLDNGTFTNLTVLETGKLSADPFGTSVQRRAYMPVDPQPFIVEVFIGHVYAASDEVVPDGYVDPDNPPEGWDPGIGCALAANGIEPSEPYLNSGQYLVFDTDERRSVIVAVQIANPFDVPIDLTQYRLEVMGNGTSENRVDLSTIGLTADNRFLPPARNGLPSTAIFYAIKNQIGDPPIQLREEWEKFLDLAIPSQGNHPSVVGNANQPLPPGTLVLDVSAFGVETDSREPYDNAAAGRTVSISRRDDSITGNPLNPTWVTVDRIDPPGDLRFRERVRFMEDYKPRSQTDVLGGESELCFVLPDEDDFYQTYAVDSPDHHWVQWVRATRAWGVDLNGNGAYEAHENNPRFVFGDRAIVVPTWHGTPEADNPDPANNEEYRFSSARRALNAHNREDDRDFPGANIYDFSANPNSDPSIPGSKPWFARSYYNSYGDLVDGVTPSSGRTPGFNSGIAIPQRKPTFFALGWREGPQWNNEDWDDDRRQYFMPDKGWYGQFKINLREAVESANSMTTEIFKTQGVGWGIPGQSDPLNPDPTAQPTSGVDDPTVLYDDVFLRIWDEANGVWTQISWDGQILPLFRQPYSMQMTLKNKHIPEDYSLAGFSADEQDELLRNRDFEQIGELLNVWLFGHEIRYQVDAINGQPNTNSVAVVTTFAEHMSRGSASSTTNEGMWTLTGGTPDFDEETIDVNYVRLQDWLADPEKNRINRVRLTPYYFPDRDNPSVVLGDIVDRPLASDEETYLNDFRHGTPALPAGVRVLDAFVIDGPGRHFYISTPTGVGWADFLNATETLAFEVVERRKFYNANGFTGKSTPGLININTAPLEVLRTLPHMMRIVHEDESLLGLSLADNPFPEVPRALIRYRERFGIPDPATLPGYGVAFDSNDLIQGPAYAHRGRDRDWFRPGDGFRPFLFGSRGERGMASIGEINLLTQGGRVGKVYAAPPNEDLVVYGTGAPGNPFEVLDYNSSWRIDYAAMPERKLFDVDVPPAANSWTQSYLYGSAPGPLPSGITGLTLTSSSARISTDVVEEFDDGVNTVDTPGYLSGLHPDLVAEDAQESNLLFSGLSNLVTTRSDVFTVYFRVRSFRQNPVTGKWDATDPDYIVDDSRYVMLVDRSEVNKPSDKPKILYLEKLPK